MKGAGGDCHDVGRSILCSSLLAAIRRYKGVAVTMILHVHIQLNPEFVAEFCKRHHVRRLSLFGSVLTDRFRPESDVDVLIEFEPEQTPGLFALARMQFEIEAVIGRPVDLRTSKFLSRFLRDEVLRLAEVQYPVA
jgi:predicted nucleotidyltransferase